MGQSEYDQFAKLFGVLGAITGLGYGAVMSDGNGIFALVLAVIGGSVGTAVGKLAYRLIMIGLLILGVLIRHQIFEALGKIFE